MTANGYHEQEDAKEFNPAPAEYCVKIIRSDEGISMEVVGRRGMRVQWHQLLLI